MERRLALGDILPTKSWHSILVCYYFQILSKMLLPYAKYLLQDVVRWLKFKENILSVGSSVKQVKPNHI